MTPSGEAAVGQMRSRTEFTLNGSRIVLTRDQVDSRLAEVVPGPVRTHCVRVNNTWYPVRQAFGLATGLPGLDFTELRVLLLQGEHARWAWAMVRSFRPRYGRPAFTVTETCHPRGTRDRTPKGAERRRRAQQLAWQRVADLAHPN